MGQMLHDVYVFSCEFFLDVVKQMGMISNERQISHGGALPLSPGRGTGVGSPFLAADCCRICDTELLFDMVIVMVIKRACLSCYLVPGSVGPYKLKCASLEFVWDVVSNSNDSMVSTL